MLSSVQWFSPAELAALKLPGMPTTARAFQLKAKEENWFDPENEGKCWRRRNGRGGGYEFTPYVLDTIAQAALVARILPPAEPEGEEERGERSELWDRYRKLPEHKQERAKKAHRILMMVESWIDAKCCQKKLAIAHIAKDQKVGKTTIYNWYRDVRGLDKCDWLPALADRLHGNRKKYAGCDEQALEFFKSRWLQPEKPKFEKCYRDLVKAAEEQGWVIPSINTMKRRVKELPQMVVMMARHGRDAAKQMIPAQERDRTYLHAMQAVNADGHKWDIFVLWPDGMIARPVMAAWQDLYSDTILSWRVDRSENTDLIQLAFGDMIEKWGIPEEALMDNGRAFASKRMTGGAKTRFRFKIKEDDVNGVMTILGVKTHWAIPRHGQSKPIERAFGDMEENIAKDLRFAGAYVGNNPRAKPENYGSKAIPLAEFLKVVEEGIKEHNNRPKRNTPTCGGKKSFFQAFSESLAIRPVRKATEAQRHLWLMAAENVTVNKINGSIRFMKNRYFADFLHEYLGQKVVVRYDPQNLHADLHVYDAKGSFLGNAPAIEKTGFFDTQAAGETKRKERKILRNVKENLEIQRSMTPGEMIDLLPKISDAQEDLIETKVVRPLRPKPFVSNGNAAVAQHEDEEEDWLSKYNEQVRPSERSLRLVDTDED
ncbi:transposase domain-containing protein [Acetobacter persici]|uniref:Transposase n=1 Tax=Acetobacter persici TaxID=1076596 RepID=A0A6V8IB65_9PROT|nr:transposase domain-containing protein [Acetobacter persici]GFE94869.1 transposase [Acetobacter persici]